MENFQNGRSIDFVQKSNLILFVYFTETMPERIVFRYFGKKTTILDQKIEVLNRAKKWTFFKRVSPCILSKSLTFSYRRFSQII